ncbi:MAG: CoB--CoM heterodisulfide reductase iron-sulfur subunit B family protein [bacterium]|jgi:heterodisulfide reductase subunit B|nr:CoB--CoM heterodisulfide reductase iron-sulfur subunit B family protein [bacterium]
MRIPYYPGCTLKTQAQNFETSTISALKELGVDAPELDRWNCCGTTHSLAVDNLMLHLAPVRNLIFLKNLGEKQVLTLCSMCYHTLSQANLLMRDDDEKRQKINWHFEDIAEDGDYHGEVEVLHLFHLLRDIIGFDKIKEAVKQPLEGLKAACYYGCLLLRPKEIAVDDPEMPQVMENLLRNLGAEAADFYFQNECCGAFQTVGEPELVKKRTGEIVAHARQQDADFLVVSCPLCFFNLDKRQLDLLDEKPGYQLMPILYIGQLLALALGVSSDVCNFELHHVDPRPLLTEKNLVSF